MVDFTDNGVFMANISKLPKIPNKLPIPDPNAAGKAVELLINAWKDYKEIHERESTKREAIKAYRDTKIEEIKAQRNILELYLVKTFKEREKVITGMFDVLDKGIDTGDQQLIANAMNTIIATIQTSPLKDIQNMRLQLDDPNIESIEI